jgi:hypothetical protein
MNASSWCEPVAGESSCVAVTPSRSNVYRCSGVINYYQSIPVQSNTFFRCAPHPTATEVPTEVTSVGATACASTRWQLAPAAAVACAYGHCSLPARAPPRRPLLRAAWLLGSISPTDCNDSVAALL